MRKAAAAQTKNAVLTRILSSIKLRYLGKRCNKCLSNYSLEPVLIFSKVGDPYTMWASEKRYFKVSLRPVGVKALISNTSFFIDTYDRAASTAKLTSSKRRGIGNLAVLELHCTKCMYSYFHEFDLSAEIGYDSHA